MPKVMLSVEELVAEINKYGGIVFRSVVSDLYTNPETREFAREVVGQVVQCHICRKVFMRSSFTTGEITCLDGKTVCLHHHGVISTLKFDWEKSFGNDLWKNLEGVDKYLAKEGLHESVVP